MGKFWDMLTSGFKKPQQQISHDMREILSGIVPLYSSGEGFGNNIYASDVVQQAVYSIVKELKKLDPVHVRKMIGKADFISVDGDIQKVLDNPNPLMTTTDFIEKVAWLLLLNYNAFVYPIWQGDTLKGLYPLRPSLVEFDTNYLNSGETWIRFHFPNGDVYDCPYENVIHLRHKYSASDFMGGNELGQPDFGPLLETLKLNDTLLKGLAKSLNLQTTINGLVQLKSMYDKEEQIKKVKEFEQKIQSNESGIGVIDIEANYIPIQKQVQLLDATTLEFIDKKIFRWFGVSIPFVDGTYTREEYEAVYQSAIEPIVKTLCQAFTKGIFSKRQINGYKNKIMFFTQELIFMNTDQKLSLFDMLTDTESCYKNELRVNFGMRPLKEFEGQLASSSNKTNAENNKAENDLASGENDNQNGGADNE